MVVADEPQSEYGGPNQSGVRPAGLGAALAPVVAAVELAALPVAVNRHEPLAQPTAHPARQEVGALGPALDPAPMGAANGSGVMIGSWRPGNHSPFIWTSPR